MRRSIVVCGLACLLAVGAPARAAKGPATALAHTVWLGPGCDQLVEMDEFYEWVAALIQESGVRAGDRSDRLELECFGKLLSSAPRVRAYVSARVTITRMVSYHGLQGRLLLNRDTRGVDLEAASLAGLREPLRRALRSTVSGALHAYGRGVHDEVVATPYPWPQRIHSICAK